MASNILRLEDVNVFRGPAHIIRDFSLEVKEGETVALVGRNGAGKTTLINAIIGILPTANGKIEFKGQNITHLPPHKRAKLGIGYAPDDRKIFTDLTVYENLLIPIRYAKVDEKSALENIFASFPKLRELLSRKGLHLSGGEQKMLAVARALALSPSLILLDEPLEGLAPIAVEAFITSLKTLKMKNVALLIAESNLYYALRLADIIYFIDRGEVTWHGPPNEVPYRRV
ncbi:MAG: ABC transporter ATP-binding protein [Nitrososphaeria archaeon]